MTIAFDSVLIANRGEIALRVMRSAREQGYRVIAVYSAADSDAPHVRYADEAYCIGPAPARDSYLSIDNVLAAARDSGAQAIHPGYGFLSENADFAHACEAAKVVFIGPNAEAIELMGNKAAAKRRMLAAGVPCVPGFQESDATDDMLLAAADSVGFPLMVKAAAGGGGRGMVLVDSPPELPDALRSARAVALSSFGSDELILERAILRPRHVEVQVFADSQGGVIHLGERDCSLQRRHQKVIEEAPCPVMTDTLRDEMGAAAVEAARTINYRGAGTVEFLLDDTGQFYFLEMNTRLQVEHPVTEMVTGLDLVELQFRVARGEPLGLSQEQVSLNGHAMEARLYAEDPQKNFLPRTGTISLWQAPQGARVDAGIESGYEVSPHYDPMLAKVIVWGESRDTARRKLIEALQQTVLFGVQTNRDFLIQLLQQPGFVDGTATTGLIGDSFGTDKWLQDNSESVSAAVAAVLLTLLERDAAFRATVKVSPELLNWSSSESLISRYQFGESLLLVQPRANDIYGVNEGGKNHTFELLAMDECSARLRLGSRVLEAWFFSADSGQINLSLNGGTDTFQNKYAFTEKVVSKAGSGRIDAPMHGVVQEIFVASGERVSRGHRLAVLEAMKMQHDILADVDGVISQIAARPGEQVVANDLLITIEQEVV